MNHPSPLRDTALKHIDLNADLGEGGLFDVEILRQVSSANIACGGHAGDADTMRQAIRLALEHQVVVGAHPSFLDRDNFGRVAMHPTPADLYRDLCRQFDQLLHIAHEEGAVVQHLKPHGALYNQAAKDANYGQVIIDVIRRYSTRLDAPALSLVALAGSPLVAQARQAGIIVIEEAFIDRRYQSDGSLVPRTQQGACLETLEEASKQCLRLVQRAEIEAFDGKIFSAHADTLCVHGDGAHAVELITHIRQQLNQHGISIAASKK